MPQFFFARVNPDETTFGSEHQRKDERVVSFSIPHAEGQIPQAQVKIKNHGSNFLDPANKLFAWIAWDNDATVVPLFFGRLVGVPGDLLNEVLTLLITAEPIDFYLQKQAIAQARKRLPNYDPVFIAAEQRDDPDVVLEGYSALYHVDRFGAVSVSDILVGEDGLEVFAPSDIRYESLQYSLSQPPKGAVAIDASVSWTQTATGTIALPARVVETYTGDGFISDWPKPGTNLGDAWSVATSQAIDLQGTGDALVASTSWSWQNKEKQHNNGDTLSTSVSASIPMFAHDLSAIITEHSQTGVLDPYSDPQVNIPPSYSNTTAHVGFWAVQLAMTLQYDMARPRTERLRFTLQAHLQPVLSVSVLAPTPDPTAVQPDKVSVPGVDVGFPVLDVLNAVDVIGQAVAVGTIIHDVVSESYQICIAPGTAGSTPVFTDIVGAVTVDGGVTWAGLGPSLINPASTSGWVANDATPLGQVIYPKKLTQFLSWTTLLPPVPVPSVGVSVSIGQIIRASDNSSYQMVTVGGTTGLTEPAFSAVRGTVTVDNLVEYTSLGPTLPAGGGFQLATAISGGGLTGPTVPPNFSALPGATTLDNEVTWTALGTQGAFTGIPIGDIARSSYFPTDRGQQSIQYLLNIARAKLRMQARCVQISFDCRWERVLALSCRKNVLVQDHRLPNGYALGKVVSYTIEANETPGLLKGKITIACAIGRGAAIGEVTGTPTIFEEGVFEPGLQVYAGARMVLDSEDIGFAPPVDVVGEDGLVLPLSYDQVVLKNEISGSAAAQAAAIALGFAAQRAAANPAFPVPGALNAIDANIAEQKRVIELNKRNVSAQIKLNPLWLDLWLKPLNGPFANEYDVAVTTLELPRQINLGAP